MTKEEKLSYDLQEEVIYLHDTDNVPVAAHVSGVINKAELIAAKHELLNDLIKHSITDLVKSTEGYPKNGLIDVKLELDAVVMPAELYNKILNHLNG